MPCKNPEYMKEYKEKNKEQIAKQQKEYRQKNKERIAKRDKEYKEKNKEQIAEKKKEYYQKNKEKIAEYKQTPNAKKISKISDWKKRGLIHDDYNKLYDNYLENTECQECGVTYGLKGDGTGTFKCMDHDHKTGLFRNFLCNGCNVKRG